QQLLRRNRRAADIGVHLGEARRQRGQHLVGHPANHTQRMVLADTLLGRRITEHVTGLLVRSTHAVAPFARGGSMVGRRDHNVDPPASHFFSTLLAGKFKVRPPAAPTKRLPRSTESLLRKGIENDVSQNSSQWIRRGFYQLDQ